MTVTFQDLQDREPFSVGGVRYIKGQHPAYQPHEPDEAPPNAHRPHAPRLYVRFEPTLPVSRASSSQDLRDGDSFTVGGVGYVKGKHPTYQSHDKDEVPPNAHRPDAPHLYVRFGSARVVN
jgi:hypothetical protein